MAFLKLLSRNLAFALFLWLSGCGESDLEDQPLPTGKPKLVVTGFISPEKKGVEIFVSKSRVLYSTDTASTPWVIEDATVLFSDGITTVQLPYNSGSGNYADTSVIIVPGQTYRLTVTAPGDFKVTASCTVPLKMNTSVTARFDSSFTQPESDIPDYVVETTWKDIPGEGDFYKVSVFQKLKDPAMTEDTLFSGLPMDESGLARDYQADGRSFRTVSTSISFYRQLLSSNVLKGFYIYLLTTDRHYYEYHQSLLRFSQLTEFDEKYRIYTNIEGGLGIFAAYRSYRTQLKH